MVSKTPVGKNITLNKYQRDFWNKYYNNYVRTIRSKGPKKVVKGKIYMFQYQAKTVPFWDSNPLVFMLEASGSSEYFLGLSLHYLPPKLRELFIKKVLLMNYRFLKVGKPAQLDYGMIKGMANAMFREGIAIIKKYKKSRVRSLIAEIPYTEWVNIATASGDGQWMNITAQGVWEITKKKLIAALTGKKPDKKRRLPMLKNPRKPSRPRVTGSRTK